MTSAFISALTLFNHTTLPKDVQVKISWLNSGALQKPTPVYRSGSAIHTNEESIQIKISISIQIKAVIKLFHLFAIYSTPKKEIHRQAPKVEKDCRRNTERNLE